MSQFTGQFRLPRLLAAAALTLLATARWGGRRRQNWYNDPFAQAAHGHSHCPVAQDPLLTQDEMRQQAHERVERGIS
jgi:hypothetical protein